MILFFDGVCHLCNNFVRLITWLDKAGRVQFAPLQGKTAEKLLSPELTDNPSSLVVLSGDKILRESEAVFAVISELPTPWRWLIIFRRAPRPLVDTLYRLVAQNRYRLFGKYTECPLPPAQSRSRFLP